MAISLTPVARDDLNALFDLRVTEEQDGFVASTAITLAQAPYETGAYTFAIRAEDKIVGLLAIIDFREHQYLMAEDDPASAYVWRLLIDQAHQAKGYGRAAMMLAMDWARARGNPRVTLSTMPGNAVALRLYESLGFARTGVVVNGEIVLSRDLGPR